MKMNLPQDEAEQCVRKVRERKMGYWFENMEKMDIQAERKNTADARAELEKTRQELDEAKREADEAKKEANEAKKKVDEIKEKANEALVNGFRAAIEIYRELGLSKEETFTKVLEKLKGSYKGLDESEIKAILEAEIDTSF